VRFEAEIHYTASPADVGTMLADAEFSDRKCAATGALRHTVEVDGDASGAFTVSTVRTMPTDAFPDVARTFVGDTVDIRQVDSWKAPSADGTRAGTITVEIAGAPLRLKGALALAGDARSTVETIHGDLKASVPIIGGKLERAAEPALQAAIRKEEQVGTEWLGSR